MRMYSGCERAFERDDLGDLQFSNIYPFEPCWLKLCVVSKYIVVKVNILPPLNREQKGGYKEHHPLRRNSTSKAPPWYEMELLS